MLRNYKKLLEQYKDNINIIDEIEYLHLLKIKIKNFKPGFFTITNIKNYTTQVIHNACCNNDKEILKYGLLNNENHKKIKLYLKNIPYVKSTYIKKLSLNEINKLVKIAKECDIENILGNYNLQIDDLKDVLNNEMATNDLITLFNMFNIYYTSPTFFKTLQEKNFHNFMHLLDKSYITNENTVDDIFAIYYDNKELFNNVSKNKRIINNYIFNKYEFDFELTNENLNNFYELREKNMIEKCNKKQDKGMLEILSKIYFNRRYKKVKELLIDSKSLIDIPDYDLFLEEYSLDNVCEIVKKLKYKTNITNEILKKTKPLAKKNLINSLIIKKKEKLQYLNGEDFFLLVHKIKGIDNLTLANELYDKPETWSKYKDKNSYISTSAINQDFVGIVDGLGYILGFNNIKEKDILAICPMDILSDRRILNPDITNSIARYTDSKTLIENTCMMYNEIVLRRYNDNNPLMPDFIFSKDAITDKDIEVSEYFNIPIIKLNCKTYADKLMKKFNYYASTKKYIKAKKILQNVAYSFYNDNDVVNIYFKDLELDVYNLCKDIDTLNINQLKELLELVKTYNDVSSILNEFTYKIKNIDTEDAEKKINKKIFMGD